MYKPDGRMDTKIRRMFTIPTLKDGMAGGFTPVAEWILARTEKGICRNFLGKVKEKRSEDQAIAKKHESIFHPGIYHHLDVPG